MEGHLLISGKERERLKILSRVKGGELKIVEAAELLGICQRQARRQYKRYRELGDRGLIHRSRGRPSNRGYAAAFKEKVLARYRERYPDFGPTLAAEKLASEGLAVDEETLRRWLRGRGCGSEGASVKVIAVSVNDGRTLASWCKWMARIMSGLKSGARSAV